MHSTSSQKLLLGYSICLTILVVGFAAHSCVPEDSKVGELTNQDEAAVRGIPPARKEKIGSLRAKAEKPRSEGEAATLDDFIRLSTSIKYSQLLSRLKPKMTQIEADHLKTILIARAISQATARQEAGAFGHQLREDIGKINAKYIKEIMVTFGSEVADKIVQYDRTFPMRKIIDAINQRLIYEDSGMNASQIEQLLQVMDVEMSRSGQVDGTAAPIPPDPEAELAYQHRVVDVSAVFLSHLQTQALSDYFSLQYLAIKRLGLRNTTKVSDATR